MRSYFRTVVAALIIGVDVTLLVVFLNVTGWLDGGAAAGPTPTPWPTPTVAQTVRPTPQPRTATAYVIRSGDTLGDIAKRYGLTVQDLQKANGISDPNSIRAGQTITIPVVPSP